MAVEFGREVLVEALGRGEGRDVKGVLVLRLEGLTDSLLEVVLPEGPSQTPLPGDCGGV